MNNLEERLRQQEYEFNECQRIANLGTYRLNLESGQAEATDKLKAIFGFEPDHELEVQNWFDAIHPDHKKMMEDYYQEVIEEQKLFEKEYKIVRASDGDVRWVFEKAEVKLDEHGKPVGLYGAVQDITERKKTESELRESKELLRKIFESLEEAVIILNPENRKILDCNRGTEKMFGYSRNELIGKTTEILHIDERRFKRFGGLGVDEFEKSGVFNTEYVMQRKNGEIFRTDHTITMVSDDEGRIDRVVSVVRDITEKKKSEEKNIRSIIEGSELERKRIAKELHDSLGQYLTAATMYFEHVEDFMDELPSEQKQKFRKGLDQINKAIGETRTISQNLLPKVIEDFGLALAVESLVDEIKADRAETINYEHNLGDHKLPETVELNMYRIVQESLHNALKHSNCSRVDLQLVLEHGDIYYTIEDNGIGFNPEEKTGEGLGLWNLKNRVNGLSGDLEISSRPENGTVISVYIPL